MVGGTGDCKQATAEIQTMCDQLKGDVENKAGKKFDHFQAHSYCSQVVAGTNFFVKIDVGNDQFAHVRIFRPLPHTGEPPNVHSVQHPKAKEDVIGYF